MLNMRAGLFIGTETFTWLLSDFRAAAQRAKALGVDTLIVKIADGTQVWYASLGGGDAWQGVWNVLGAIQGQGVQVLPYFFSYGNKFGAFQGEVNLANYVLSKGFDVCLDMESDWNGQDTLAKQLIFALNGPVWVSTWADPALQNFNKVLQALAPKTRFFLPQVYTPFLQGVWQQQYSAAGIPDSQIIPTINDQTLSVAGGRAAITLWEYNQLSDAQIIGVLQSLAGNSFVNSGGDGLALIQHPNKELRIDVVVVGTDGNLYRSHNGGTGGWPTDLESWGNPGKPLVALSASGAWDVEGNYLNVIAATADGEVWGVTHSYDNSQVVPWAQIAGITAALPTGQGGTDTDDAAIITRVSALETFEAKLKAAAQALAQ